MGRHLRRRKAGVKRIEGIIYLPKVDYCSFRQTHCRIKSFCRGERLGASNALVRVSVRPMTVRPFLYAFDVLLSSRRSRQMKALFRRIDKINRVAHDNADNFATIRTRPASGARTNKYALAGNAREKRTGGSVGLKRPSRFFSKQRNG